MLPVRSLSHLVVDALVSECNVLLSKPHFVLWERGFRYAFTCSGPPDDRRVTLTSVDDVVAARGPGVVVIFRGAESRDGFGRGGMLLCAVADAEEVLAGAEVQGMHGIGSVPSRELLDGTETAGEGGSPPERSPSAVATLLAVARGALQELRSVEPTSFARRRLAESLEGLLTVGPDENVVIVHWGIAHLL